jgi:hypothetical protein
VSGSTIPNIIIEKLGGGEKVRFGTKADRQRRSAEQETSGNFMSWEVVHYAAAGCGLVTLAMTKPARSQVRV